MQAVQFRAFFPVSFFSSFFFFVFRSSFYAVESTHDLNTGLNVCAHIVYCNKKIHKTLHRMWSNKKTTYYNNFAGIVVAVDSFFSLPLTLFASYSLSLFFPVYYFVMFIAWFHFVSIHGNSEMHVWYSDSFNSLFFPPFRSRNVPVNLNIELAKCKHVRACIWKKKIANKKNEQHLQPKL